MGASCCMRLDSEKMRRIVLKTQEEQKRQMEDFKAYYKENKVYMNTKIKAVFKVVWKTGKYDSDLVNFNFVNLQKNRIEYFQVLIPFLHNIKILKLWKCFITADGMKLLANDFRSLTYLEVLSLEDNSLGSEGCISLCGPLRELKYIRELWLHINDINAVGAFYLADTLVTMKNLEKLGLDENSIGNQGILKIANSVKKLKFVNEIGIGYNMIDEDALLKFVEILSVLDLTKLILSGNTLCDEGHQRVLTLLPKTNVIF